MAASLDWPLSRKEKELRLVNLFQDEIAHGEAQRRSLKSQLAKERRRASLPAQSPSARACSPLRDDGVLEENARTPNKLASSASTPSLAPAPAASVASSVSTSTTYSMQSRSRSQQKQEDVAHGLSEASRSVSRSRGRESTGSKDAIEGSSAQEIEMQTPLTARQRCLRAALINFYKERNINGTVQATKLARMCVGGSSGIDETIIWSHVCAKYNALPTQAVAYMVRTMSPWSLVQWGKEEAPDAAREALDRIIAGEADDDEAKKRRIIEIEAALKTQNNDVLSALIFRGCPTPEMRPEVWGALLRWQQGRNRGPLSERRAQYRRLRDRIAKSGPKSPKNASSRSLDSPEDYQANAERWRHDIAADLQKAWQGEAFLAQAGVVEAATAIAFTIAARYGRYIRGSCEMAVLLLFVMSNEGLAEKLEDAEPDAFWCLTQIMLDMNGTIVDNTNQARQAQHIQYLLRLYDPNLQELLRGAGIVALPTTRFGTALCTRAGFSLPGCARLWDALLSDPKRFTFGNYAIVAVILLSSKRLMEQRHDNGALAEAVVAAPRRVDMDAVLATAYAICAFERRCGDSSSAPYPPRPGVLEVLPSALEAAQTHISSAWDKVRAGVGGTWRKVGTTVAQKRAEWAENAAAAQREEEQRRRSRGAGLEAPLLRRGSHGNETAITAALEAGII